MLGLPPSMKPGHGAGPSWSNSISNVLSCHWPWLSCHEQGPEDPYGTYKEDLASKLIPFLLLGTGKGGPGTSASGIICT